MSNDTRSRPMTTDTIHTCSYSCERPGCIRAQRDELAARLTAAQQQEQVAPPSAPVGVELAALRVQEWLHAEHDLLVPVQEIEAAMRTPCSCPATEHALAQQPAAAQPDWEVAPPGATHYQPHQGAYYKRVSASEWYVWDRVEDREMMRWLPSPGTGDNAEWVVRPTDAMPSPSAPVGVDWPIIVEGLRLADRFFDGDDRYWKPASTVRAAYLAALAAQQQGGRTDD